jgi:hypothetical protein
MIPTTASDEQLEQYVQNICIAWECLTCAQQERGRMWYPVAHQVAAVTGDGDVRTGAGLIAVLSANKRWELNLSLARDAASGNVHGHTGVTLEKVRKILDGTDPLLVLPDGSKTLNFYRCILNPADPDPVVIDRHAHDIAVGEIYGNRDRGLSNLTRYATLAHAYRLAARELGDIPSVVQAGTWTGHVEMLAGTSSRGPREGREKG